MKSVNKEEDIKKANPETLMDTIKIIACFAGMAVVFLFDVLFKKKL